LRNRHHDEGNADRVVAVSFAHNHPLKSEVASDMIVICFLLFFGGSDAVIPASVPLPSYGTGPSCTIGFSMSSFSFPGTFGLFYFSLIFFG
jgi:hypothetical protein